MTSPKAGDRVRVTFEAEYVYLDFDGEHYVKVEDDRHLYAPGDAVVEVLPNPLKVGDRVVDSAQLADLPDGSVVCRPDQSAVPIGKRRGTWYAGAFPIGAATIGAWSDATVLRIGTEL